MNKIKRIFGVLTAVLLILNCATISFASQKVRLIIDGSEVNFNNVEPVNIDGKIWLPARTLFDYIGATIYYDDATKTLTTKYGIIDPNSRHYNDGTISDINIMENFTVGQIAYNSTIFFGYYSEPQVSTFNLDDAPRIYNGRMMLSLRDVAKVLVYDVSWDDNTKTITLTSKLWYGKGKRVPWMKELEQYTIDTFGYTKEDFCLTSEQLVNRFLKAPSTASYEFNNYDDKCIYENKDGQLYVTVYGHVNSQNSFGAYLRTPFRCSFYVYGNGKLKWDKLVLDGRIKVLDGEIHMSPF